MIRPWHFYGRAQESQDLACHLEILPGLRGRRWIGTYTISGRYGVGKTKLLHEVCVTRDPAIPFLHAELSAGDAPACLETLRDAVTEAGLSSLLADMPVYPPPYSDRSRFKDIVRELLLKGAIVALDEFHHATAAGLAPSIKKMIDDLGRTADSIAPGKLVLMGSHQQQMLQMFRADQPLHGRSDASVAVNPWPVGTVLEMASEHGFLRHPGRLLTLVDGVGRPAVPLGTVRPPARFREIARFRRLAR